MSTDTSSLEEMCELVVDCPHSTPKWTDSGVIVLRNQNIRDGQLDLSSPSYTDEAGFESRIKRAVPQVGDIVFTREAPMGEVCLIPDGLKCCLGQRQVLLRPKKEVSGQYLYWALQSPFVQHQISWNEGTGTTVSNVRIPVLKALNIPRQGNSEDYIAKILSSLAEKIQINQQINQTLEQMAQAIFKSWFVDFEPVKAKIAARERWYALQSGNESASPASYAGELADQPINIDLDTYMNHAAMQAISGKDAEQLAQMQIEKPEEYAELYATAELFPSAMQDSELGKIPEGWFPVTVAHFIDLVYGKALKKTDRIEGEYPVYGSGGITGSHNQALVTGPGIIIGRKGTVGSIYWENGDFYPIDTTYYVIVKESCSLLFAFYLLQTLGLENMNTDAAVPGLNRNNVYRLEVPHYPTALIERFALLVSSFSKQIAILCKETNALTLIRDTLLPKLLSGELSVADIESEVEA